MGDAGAEGEHGFALPLTEFLGLGFKVGADGGDRDKPCGSLLENAVDILFGNVVAHQHRGRSELRPAFGIPLDRCFVGAADKNHGCKGEDGMFCLHGKWWRYRGVEFLSENGEEFYDLCGAILICRFNRNEAPDARLYVEEIVGNVNAFQLLANFYAFVNGGGRFEEAEGWRAGSEDHFGFCPVLIADG